MKRATTTSIFAALLGLCFALCGCSTTRQITGRDFDTSKVSLIVNGKTTRDEITGLFGAPQSVNSESNDTTEVWTYTYTDLTVKSHMTLRGNDTVATGNRKVLHVLFDQNHVVKNVTLDMGPLNSVLQDNSF